MTDDDRIKKLTEGVGVERWEKFSIRVDIADSGLVRLLLIKDASTAHAVEMTVQQVDAFINTLFAQSAKIRAEEKAPFRANPSQLHALVTFLRNQSKGNKFSPEWQWGEIALSGAQQLQEFIRLKDMLKQKDSVEMQISRILEGPK